MKQMTVSALYQALEARFPRSLSCSWDNDGLMVCPDPDAAVTGVLIALDATEEVVETAVNGGYNVILTHHPMVFRGIKAVDGHDTVSRKVIRLVQAGISVMSFHTRLDTVDGGVNDTLAARLGLSDVIPFGDKDNAEGKPMGRVGSLPSPMTLDEFACLVKEKLQADGIFTGDAHRPVSRVAVLGGGGDGDVAAARAVGADTYVTGELKYHQLCDAPYEGLNLLQAGHFETEFPVCDVLKATVLDLYAQADLPAPAVTVMNSHRIRLI